MSGGDAAARAAERVARDSYGRLVAFLAARSRDIADAEDALGEAFAAALRTWPGQGVPDNPDAWLLTTARRRQVDAMRRRRTHEGRSADLRAATPEATVPVSPEPIPDRRLALMFACAHPAVDRSVRAPLILQTILGLTAHEIAAAFLVPPATMGQRLVRGKARIRDAGIPFEVPSREDLPVRLEGVLDAIYAGYAKGWGDPGEDAVTGLAGEAVWLGQLVVSLLPDEPEAKGLLALMLYAEARREARRDEAGAYVPLEQQDTARWDQARLAQAEHVLRDASRGGPSGRFQLEAAIQSAHVARRITGAPTWPAVLALYDHLRQFTDSPVVVLNRAVALAEVQGVEAALAGPIAALAEDPRMRTYQPYWATRAHLLARAARADEAAAAFTVAIGLSTDDAVRRHLQERRAALRG
ncbi:DNA-directed RNA polymerase sigma-70 factor [Luteitalea sp. TBR-22]|uniref:RNA polymerase sigma factor n=1 Tax=Luteitalea sp. TBR-22 TaxID=2802971 RepID=UPI001AF18840|nr:DUF6596 domain-containing protein [Luteitalea sp. TBR-22]BCS31721.1 DNA-directed RNA polymerase sigma-70 factor [Luteitalea sp. TBR-22]